ncbi:MAG: hypothetical protein J6S65_06300 [Bacteroidaceae bacterium]|nr:hypothetical protein [Bacteroidaceae bacterium]
MKKFLLMFALLLTASTAMIAQSTSISINKVKDEIDDDLAGFYFGGNTALGGPDNMSINLWKSWEIGFDLPLWSPKITDSFYFHMNLGFNWKNFRSTDADKSFEKNYTNKEVYIGAPEYLTSPTGAKGYVDFSRMKIYSLTIPLLFEVKASEKFSIAAGPVVNFNLHGSLKTKYYNERGEYVTFTSNGLRQQVVTGDLKGMIIWDKLGLYCKWSPMRQLQDKYAPTLDFKGMSFGLQLCM